MFQRRNLSFGPLESVLSLEGVLSSCTCMPCSSRPELADVIKEAGFDVISFSSNHTLEYGREAFCEICQHIRDAGLYFNGACENYKSARTFQVKDTKGIIIVALGYN